VAEMTTRPVDPTNTEQARAWDGNEGAFWARNADGFEQSVARYDPHLLAAADIAPTTRVLDVGCGTGSTSRLIARVATAGTVLGVDLSARMIEVARERAARDGIGNVVFEQADAQIHPFAAEAVDVVVSRTGTMFFGDPAAAYANLARALVPGGRLAMLVWQPPSDNEWIVAIATALAARRDLPAPPLEAPGPFSMSDPDRVHRLLGRAGFAAPRCTAVSEPMVFGADVDSACAFILGNLGWMLEGLDDSARAQAIAELRRSLQQHRTDLGVAYGSAAWLVTADRR